MFTDVAEMIQKKKMKACKKFVEVARGVFRDPTQVYIRESDGAHIKYSEDSEVKK